MATFVTRIENARENLGERLFSKLSLLLVGKKNNYTFDTFIQDGFWIDNKKDSGGLALQQDVIWILLLFVVRRIKLIINT